MLTFEISDSNTPDTIIRDLMRIEENVYPPEYRGEYSPIQKRFAKNREMFVLARDDDFIIGYLCFMPINDELFHQIADEGRFHDDDITPDSITRYMPGSHIYLLSVAVLKKYQDTSVAEGMTKAFFEFLDRKSDAGAPPADILAATVTPSGEKYIKRLGFTLLHDYFDREGYKIYYLNLQKSEV